MSDNKPTEQEKQLARDLGIKVQPDPISNKGASSHDLVMADLEKRKQFGLQKYKTLLQANNGRDSIQDAYEEILDAAVYLRTLIEERDSESNP